MRPASLWLSIFSASPHAISNEHGDLSALEIVDKLAASYGSADMLKTAWRERTSSSEMQRYMPAYIRLKSSNNLAHEAGSLAHQAKPQPTQSTKHHANVTTIFHQSNQYNRLGFHLRSRFSLKISIARSYSAVTES